MNNQDRPHALFSPSKLAILDQCPNFVSQTGTSAAAERGTEIHDRIITAFSEGETLEGIEGIALDLLREIYVGYQFETFSAEYAIATSIPHVSGYADLVFFTPKFSAVIEIKTGWGERGHCKDSLQVKALALGLLEQGYETVACWLIEADKHTDTSYSYNTEDISDMKADILTCISSALQPARYQQGSYCSYCAKSVVCPEIESAVINLTSFSEEIEKVKSFPPALVAERLNAHYEKGKLIEKYLATLKGRAMAIIEAEGEIKGWHIKETPGTRSWIDETEAVWQISEGYPNAQISKIMTPSGVEKELKQFDSPKNIKVLLSRLTKQATKKTLEQKKEGE